MDLQVTSQIQILKSLVAPSSSSLSLPHHCCSHPNLRGEVSYLEQATETPVQVLFWIIHLAHRDSLSRGPHVPLLLSLSSPDRHQIAQTTASFWPVAQLEAVQFLPTKPSGPSLKGVFCYCFLCSFIHMYGGIEITSTPTLPLQLLPYHPTSPK